MRGNCTHRSGSQAFADSALKGVTCCKTMERWQDKSREVRASLGGEKGNNFNLSARCAQVRRSLRFLTSDCAVTVFRTSHREAADERG